MLRKKSYYRTSSAKDNSDEPKHTLIEDISITPKTINVLKGIHHFTNLWNLSLRYCHFHDDQTAGELLKPLNAFAYLGTLDLSYTDITFEWLQRYIRPLSIQHLKLYGIPDFIFEDPPCRGFLIFCLPLVWMINDQFITFSERRFWHRYYSPSAAALSVTADTHHFANTPSSNDNHHFSNTATNSTVGAGQYSIYMRKHYINPESCYVPSDEQDVLFDTLEDIESMKREEYDYFYNQNRFSDEYNKNKVKVGKLWSNKARLLLSKMPKHFYMPMEQDKWRIKILMQQFYLQLYEEHEGTEMETFYRENDILDHFLVYDNNIYYNSKTPNKDKTHVYTEYRIILFMLLFGSLLPEFPRDVIQKGLEFFFAKESDELYEPFIRNPDAYASSNFAKEQEKKEKDKNHYWVENPTSPLLWSNKLILTFIQMLISRIELESESASSFQNSSDTALIDKKTLSVLKLFIFNLSLNQLNGNDYEIYGSYAYVKKTQQVYLAMFNLRLIQLLTFIPRDMFFLTHFQTLYNIYAKAILLLIPLSYLETSDYNFFMSEEEMIYYLREDEEAKKQQKINQMRFEEEMQQHTEKYNKSKNQKEKKTLLKEITPQNMPYPNKYTRNLSNILKKKISPILKNTSKYNRLFVTTMDVHGRAVELRYYLNNSIMHVYEAEQIYDSMNRLLGEKDLVVKGKKVFFNTVEVSLHDVREDFNVPLQKNNSINSTSSSTSLTSLSTDPKSNPANLGKINSTGQLSNESSKQRKRGLRHRHSMRSLRSSNQYESSPAKQRSANISKASLLSSAASSTIFSNQLDGIEELLPPPSSNSSKGFISTLNNNKNMRKTTSSLFDRSILNDQRLLQNIYSINETIMNAPKVQKVIAKRERKLSEAKEAKSREKESRFKREMERIKRINNGETEDEEVEEIFISNGKGRKEEKSEDNTNNSNKNNSNKDNSNKDKNMEENKEKSNETDKNNYKNNIAAENKEGTNNEIGKDNKDNDENNIKEDNKSNIMDESNKEKPELVPLTIKEKPEPVPLTIKEKPEPVPLTPKEKEQNNLKNLLARLEKENEEDRINEEREKEEKEKTEREKEEKEKAEKEQREKEQQEKEAKTEEATEPNGKQKSKNKRRKDGQSIPGEAEEDGEGSGSEEEEEEEDDENAYDDYYSSDSGSSTESSGYGYDARPDDKYTISQDFSIRNTLPSSSGHKKKENHKKRNNVNTYTPGQPKTPPRERTEEDEFIDFILYHTDVAKPRSPEKSNTTDINRTNSPVKNNGRSVTSSPPPLNRRTSETPNITSQSIQYHISHMPITGIARNYKKKTKKEELLDQLNAFYQRGNSSDSDLDFDPIHSHPHSKSKSNNASKNNVEDQNNNNLIISSINSPKKKESKENFRLY